MRRRMRRRFDRCCSSEGPKSGRYGRYEMGDGRYGRYEIEDGRHGSWEEKVLATKLNGRKLRPIWPGDELLNPKLRRVDKLKPKLVQSENIWS